VERGAEVERAKVRELMTTEPVTARPNWPLAQAVTAMEQAGINRLPCVGPPTTSTSTSGPKTTGAAPTSTCSTRSSAQAASVMARSTPSANRVPVRRMTFPFRGECLL
jgi:predicted transcriptional regulator